MLVVLAALALAASPANPGLVRVAVTDVALAPDVEARVGRVFADNLVAELRKLKGVSVVSMDEVRSMLTIEANRQAIGCSDSEGCLAEIADALGANTLVSGSIASLDGARVLSLRRIDQGRAAVVGSVEERLVAAGGEELLAAIGPAVEKLFPEFKLREGETRGVAEEKARLLHPPPVPVWVTTLTGAVAAGAALGSVATGVLAQLEAQQAQELLDTSTAKAPVDGARVVEREQSFQQLALASNVMTLGATVAAVAFAFMLPFTDWTNAAALAAAE